MSAAADPAHTLCKGVVPVCIGSLFKQVIYERVLLPRATVSQNADKCWQLMLKSYEDNGTPDRMSGFDESYIVTNVRSPHGDWAFLQAGSMSKARCLVPFALELATRFNSGSDRDQHREGLFRALFEMYRVMYEEPDHLSTKMSDQFREACYACQVHHKWLSVDSQRRNEFCWHWISKTHDIWHIGEDSQWLNPRLLWTYKGEDFVGRISYIAKSCTKATIAARVSNKIMDKYIRGICVRWARQKRCGPDGEPPQ